MSYDSTKWGCCQEKYILGELLVRTDWEVVGGARVTPCGVTKGGGQELKPDGLRELSGGGSGERIQAALTHDQGFAQAGFEALGGGTQA